MSTSQTKNKLGQPGARTHVNAIEEAEVRMSIWKHNRYKGYVHFKELFDVLWGNQTMDENLWRAMLLYQHGTCLQIIGRPGHEVCFVRHAL